MKRFKDRLRIAREEEQMQYFRPQGLEAISSEMIRANKKDFIFRQGNCPMSVLHHKVCDVTVWLKTN